MSISYEIISENDIICIRELCNELMSYQKSKSFIHSELFDNMSFETRMLPSLESANSNYIVIAKDKDEIIGYVYCNISSKNSYSNDFATFFDMNSVKNDEVGCLSQFYIKEAYRGIGIGSTLFKKSIQWLNTFESIDDFFIFVSNGNDDALNFYLKKGFKMSHQILDGFITVLRNT